MKRVKNGLELVGALTNVSALVEKDFAEILRELIYRGLEEVLNRTPVDTSFLLNNWHILVNRQPSDSTVTANSQGGGGTPAIVPVDLKNVSFVVLYNNAEYAVSIEHGTSTQRAQPMVAPTHQILVELAANLTRKLSRVKYNV